MIALAPFWIIIALAIGFFGRHYRFGFWGYFLISLLLTPVLGLLTLFAAVPRAAQRR
jgi:hypothetical protein